MHSSGSASSSRPRQRTFTSCTECRRRKQRCNQAKDRPCNNCSRRYPPVVCTYESSSPPPQHDRVLDLHDHQNPHHGSVHGPNPIGTHPNAHNQIPNPAYSQPVSSSYIPTTTSADYYPLGYTPAYYNPPTSRGFYSDGGQSDTSSAGSGAQIHVATTTAGDFLIDDSGPYYGNATANDHAAFGNAVGGFYDAHGTWVTGPAENVYSGAAGSGEYYYGGDEVARTTRG